MSGLHRAAGIVVLSLTALTGSAVRQAPQIHCGIEMRNVALHVADGVVLHVRSLKGEFISRKRGAPPVFDDPQSYTLRLQTADLAMDAASLTNLLNQHAFGAPNSPVRDLRVTIDEIVLLRRIGFEVVKLKRRQPGEVVRLGLGPG